MGVPVGGGVKSEWGGQWQLYSAI